MANPIPRPPSEGAQKTETPMVDTGEHMAGTREARLAATFITLADTLVAEYDLVDLLDLLVNVSSDLLDAAAAGLVLADNTGELSVVASTSERTLLVELMQLEAGSGPCIECFLTGVPVQVPDLGETAEKWPTFTEAATSQGFRSVHAVPMRLRGRVIGALNLFRTETGTLTDEDAAAAQALADMATIGILHERSIRESDIAKSQLQHALDSRVVIEQAKGVLAQTHGLDMDSAFQKIRSHARSNNLLLRNVAELIVARTLTL